MQVTVRLSGSLNPGRFPEHDHLRGMKVVLPEKSQIKDLFGHLGIRYSRLVLVSVDGVAKRFYDEIEDGAFVDLYLPLAGG